MTQGNNAGDGEGISGRHASGLTRWHIIGGVLFVVFGYIAAHLSPNVKYMIYISFIMVPPFLVLANAFVQYKRGNTGGRTAGLAMNIFAWLIITSAIIGFYYWKEKMAGI
jgi:hypothetical protein